MNSDSVSLSITATKTAGATEDLYEEAWDLIVATIRKNAKHRSSNEVFSDYLEDTKGDGEHSKTDISFVFLSPSSACDVQMAVTMHWFELAISIAAKELTALCLAHGYKMKAPKKTAAAIVKEARDMPFLPLGETIIGVERGKTPGIAKDNHGELSFEDAELPKATEKLARSAAKTGRCECAFCAKVRAKKTSVPKLKKEKPPPKVKPGELPELTYFTSLAKGMRSPDRCGYLELRDKGITELPEDFGKLQRLIRMDLSKNPVKVLPASLFTIKTLQELFLPSPEEIPDALGDLTNLKQLLLCAVKRIPESIEKLTQLEWLSFYRTNVAKWPDAVTRLPSLRRLLIEDLQGLTAPLPNFGALGGLTQLSIVAVREPKNALANIDFSSLKDLVQLRLDGSAREFGFPATLRDLPKLQELSVESMGGAAWPDSVSSFKALTRISAWSAKLEAWPKGLNNLPALNRVDFRDNNMRQIDDLKDLPALEELLLGSTPLEHLPAQAPKLPSLKRLSLYGTQVKQLPEWLAELPALERLDLGNTPVPVAERDRFKQRNPKVELTLA